MPSNMEGLWVLWFSVSGLLTLRMPQHLSLTMTCPFRPTHHPLSTLTHVIACMSTLARRLVTSGCDLSTGHPLAPLLTLAEGSVRTWPSQTGHPWPREDVPSALGLQQGWHGPRWTQSICPLAHCLTCFTGCPAASSLIIYLACQVSPAAKRQTRNSNCGDQSPFPLSMCVTLAMLLSVSCFLICNTRLIMASRYCEGQMN